MTDAAPFRDAQPLAWLFHRNTSRWVFNTPDTGDERHTPRPAKEYPSASVVDLPVERASADLAELLEDRASCRAFLEDGIALEQLGSVLYSAYGAVALSELGPLELVDRPVPSGGGLYPLELYLIVRAVAGVDPGVYHYAPLTCLLEQLRDSRVPRQLVSYVFMGQPYAADAAAVLVTTAVPARSVAKYGDRGYRYLLFEAGHVAQNVNLAAAAVGLGACNLGGFFDDELAAVLMLDIEYELPLYATAIGVPAARTKAGRRAVPED